MELLEKIENNFKTKYNINNENDMYALTHSSVTLSLMIATYAHKGQYRRNGEPYILHPIRMMELYKDLIGINENPENIDIDMMHKLSLPYEGIMELCLLHDVIEDTSITISDIESIFQEKKLGIYFNLYIKNELILLTHKKGEPYEEYLKRVVISKSASLVKILDMYNNSNYLTSGELENNLLDKIQNYQKYILILVHVHKFNKTFLKYNEFRKEHGRMD